MNARELMWNWLQSATTPPRTPAAQALEQQLVTTVDLVRLKVIARLHARGLAPHMDWSDLLQEAFRRVLDGSRPLPDGVPVVAFLAGVMRSIRSEQWRRVRKGLASTQPVDVDDAEAEELPDPTPDPLRNLIAIEEMEAIRELFAGDACALHIIESLYEGRTPDETRCLHGISVVDYESARKRIRRTLVREGLRWDPES